MNEFLDRHRDKFYAVLRITSGFAFLWHGSQKLLGFPGGFPSDMPPMTQYVAGPIELVGGLFLVIGLWVRPVAFLCSGLMAGAYWLAHGFRAILPIQNGGELAFVYCFLFLFIAAEGAGILSADARRASKA